MPFLPYPKSNPNHLKIRGGEGGGQKQNKTKNKRERDSTYSMLVSSAIEKIEPPLPLLLHPPFPL